MTRLPLKKTQLFLLYTIPILPLDPSLELGTMSRPQLAFTPDRLFKSIGVLSSPKIQKGLLSASKPTISILDIDKNPSLDPGETTPLKTASRKTT